MSGPPRISLNHCGAFGSGSSRGESSGPPKSLFQSGCRQSCSTRPCKAAPPLAAARPLAAASTARPLSLRVPAPLPLRAALLADDGSLPHAPLQRPSNAVSGVMPRRRSPGFTPGITPTRSCCELAGCAARRRPSSCVGGWSKALAPDEKSAFHSGLLSGLSDAAEAGWLSSDRRRPADGLPRGPPMPPVVASRSSS